MNFNCECSLYHSTHTDTHTHTNTNTLFFIPGLGIGASGRNQYAFQLIFCEPVDPKVSHKGLACLNFNKKGPCSCNFLQQCRVKFFQQEVEFRLLKKEGMCLKVLVQLFLTLCLPAGEWPRLQSSNQRPHWIMPDFDRWQMEDSEEEKEPEEDKLSREERLKEMMVGGLVH